MSAGWLHAVYLYILLCPPSLYLSLCFSLFLIGVFYCRPLFLFFYLFFLLGVGSVFFGDIQPKKNKILISTTKEKLELSLALTLSFASNSTILGKNKISDLGLPGSIEIYNTAGKFPEKLLYEIEKIQKLGGYEELLIKYNELEISSKKSFDTINEIDISVSKEEKIDGIFRGKFPEWGAGASFIGTGKGAPSNILNVDIKVSL